MSFGEWLSIIARSELGSDLDCSVINARSELGSDLDCYELSVDGKVFNGHGEELNVDGKALKINGGGVKRWQWGTRWQWGGIKYLSEWRFVKRAAERLLFAAKKQRRINSNNMSLNVLL